LLSRVRVAHLRATVVEAPLHRTRESPPVDCMLAPDDEGDRLVVPGRPTRCVWAYARVAVGDAPGGLEGAPRSSGAVPITGIEVRHPTAR
jgi:hypothetical protein